MRSCESALVGLFPMISLYLPQSNIILCVMGALKEAYPILFVLWKCSPNTFTSVVNDDKFAVVLLKALKEICHNLLYTDFPFTDDQRSELRKIQEFIQSLATGGVKTRQAKTRKRNIILNNQTKTRKVIGTVLDVLKDHVEI